MTDGSSFLTDAELAAFGFAAIGTGVRISRRASFYGRSAISLGDEVRIDDFALLSAGPAGITLEGFNHVAAGAMIFGEVTMRLWSTLSSRVAVYATSDDFGADTHTYPHVRRGRVVTASPVVIGSRVVIGTGSTILPGVTIADGVSVGAQSLVSRSITGPGLYAGIPVHFVRMRRAIDPDDANPE
jgi:galactoside O-acetyltransferase